MSDQHTSKRIRERFELRLPASEARSTVLLSCAVIRSRSTGPNGIRIHVEFIDMEWPL
jgi:hypothetical protein